MSISIRSWGYGSSKVARCCSASHPYFDFGRRPWVVCPLRSLCFCQRHLGTTRRCVMAAAPLTKSVSKQDLRESRGLSVPVVFVGGALFSNGFRWVFGRSQGLCSCDGLLGRETSLYLDLRLAPCKSLHRDRGSDRTSGHMGLGPGKLVSGLWGHRAQIQRRYLDLGLRRFSKHPERSRRPFRTPERPQEWPHRPFQDPKMGHSKPNFRALPKHSPLQFADLCLRS